MRAALAIAVLPLAFLAAALLGALIPVNRTWVEPDRGVTVYLRGNGVHVDLLMPVAAAGLDWRPLFPERDFAAPPAPTRWIAVGAGERRVYLETPTWADLSGRTAWAAIAGGERVIHVERASSPAGSQRSIRLRPQEYRRLWAAVRAQLELDRDGRPVRIDHPGYGSNDAFYRGHGKASAINTCNQWLADQLRLAGVRASLWSPFAEGLTWRYRRTSPDRL